MADGNLDKDYEEGGRDMRGKLAARLAMAGVLVAGLLGILAFFDYLSNAPDDTDEQVFSKPVPVPPKKEVSQPVKPTESLPEPPQEKVELAPAEPSVVPPTAGQPGSEGQATDKTDQTAEPGRSSVSRQPSGKVPAESRSTSIPEATSAPHNRVPASEPKPVARPVPAEKHSASLPSPTPTPLPAPVPPSAPRLFSGFILQAGVFSSIQRAEELHARLTLSGVPSTLETRVQVGPFRTRQEAEAAQAKLRELGIQAILVPPRGKN